MSEINLFTSESVSEGHPDKMADQISDAILDALLKEDPRSRVACETLIKTGMVLVAGEITTEAYVDIEDIVRGVVNDIGYNNADSGFDGHTCAVINAIGKQSPDISQGVDDSHDHEQGAGDQGLMFGYASNETDVLMPAPITYAHRLVKRQSEVRKNGTLPWLEPDAKSQLTFRYVDNKPVSIDAVVLSTQHKDSVSNEDLREGVFEEIIKPVLPEEWITKETKIFINPTGRFVIGGPVGDCGLTGRKIIVDTYGGMARHGGGAFSGKDPSKVDRSAEPTSISVETFGTGKISNTEIVRIIREHFELRPKGLIKMLDLIKPIYRDTAAYGHFGREDLELSWEKTDKAVALKAAAGI